MGEQGMVSTGRASNAQYDGMAAEGYGALTRSEIVWRFAHVFGYGVAFIFSVWTYRDVISAHYEWMGFGYSPSNMKLMISCLTVLLTAFFLPPDNKIFGNFLIHLFFLFPILPLFVYWASADKASIFMGISFLCFVLFAVIGGITAKLNGYGSLTGPAAVVICSILAVLGLALLVSFAGLSNLNFNLLKIYAYRAEIAESSPLLAEYMHPVIQKLLLPFVLSYALLNRKWLIILFSLICFVILFAATQQKAPLFVPLFIILVYFLFKFTRPSLFLIFGYVISLTVCLIPGLGLFEFFFEYMIARRAFFDPAQLSFEYYDFFRVHTFVGWSDSLLTFHLLHYPYDTAAVYLIGDRLGTVGQYADTGILGSGYMQFGYVGMIIYSVVLGVSLALINGMSWKFKNWFPLYATCLMAFVYAYTSTDLPSVFLTHGLLFSMMLIYALRPKTF